MTKPDVLLTGPMMPLIENGLSAHFTLHRLHEAKDREGFLTTIAGDVAAIVTGGHTGVKTDAAFMARFPKLKVVSNFGVGYDSIDVAAAEARGVTVCNTPDVLNEEVADTALALLLMTVREMTQAESYLRAGRWVKEGDYPLTSSLRDRSVGVIGLGRIGKAIAKRCEAFGLPISYWGRTRQADVTYTFYSDLVAMAQKVDVLIAILPGGSATKGIINGEVLAALGQNGIFVNVARGSVVDEAALIDALKRKVILGAGLDVFAAEPNVDPAFLALPNVVLTPHVGSASIATRDAMAQLVVDNATALVRGVKPRAVVAETPFKGW